MKYTLYTHEMVENDMEHHVLQKEYDADNYVHVTYLIKGGKVTRGDAKVVQNGVVKEFEITSNRALKRVMKYLEKN